MDIDYKQMLDIAKDVSQNSYAPFSKFHVGACVMGASGNFYKGCNFENSSFGLTICAERCAIGNAISNGEKQILAVAIFSPESDECYPCGACRQVIYEFKEDFDTEIITEKNETPKIDKISTLLPHGFRI